MQSNQVPPAIKAIVDQIDPAMLYPGRKAAQLIGLDMRSLETRRRKRQRPSYVTLGNRTVRYPGQELIDVLMSGAVSCR